MRQGRLRGAAPVQSVLSDQMPTVSLPQIRLSQMRLTVAHHWSRQVAAEQVAWPDEAAAPQERPPKRNDVRHLEVEDEHHAPLRSVEEDERPLVAVEDRRTTLLAATR